MIASTGAGTWTRLSVIPLTVAVPLLAAGVLAAAQPLRRRRAAEGVALVASGGTAVLCAVLVVATAHDGQLVYWFGGWRPGHGVALGIDFSVDPLSAGLATFAAVLTSVAIVFSWRHFESVGHAFPALLLVLLAAMVAFCLSGDLFDMFVFFELMTVVAIALTAYRSDERAPLQGALSFGVCNAIGGFLVLFAIALLYGRTGALNLAEIALALQRRPPDGLVIVAFGLLASGFLIKAAIVPFHFWLADAYASAPTPVCIVFAGVMSEMGLFGLARVYETVQGPSLASHADAIRLVLVIAGAVTALGGAVMCLLQELIKRVLAFAVVSAMGVFLIGFGTLDVQGLAGASIDVVAGGLIKAGLFVCVGVLQNRRADRGSLRLRGLGRGLPVTGTIFVLGALGLTGVPGSGPFLARTLIEAGAKHPGLGWVPYVIATAETLTGAGILAVAARAFLGWGPDLPTDTGEGDDPEDPTVTGDPPSWLLVGPAAALVAGGIAIGLIPGITRIVVAGAARFADGAALDHGVITGHATAVALPSPVPTGAVELVVGAALTAASVAIAVVFAVPRRAPVRPAAATAVLRRASSALDALHDGHVGEYVTWLAAGTAILCGALLLAVR